jgi:hypothetical protein
MFLIDEETGKWYCYKDDQAWMGKEQRWLGETSSNEAQRKQMEQLQQEKQTVKYCKKCGNRLELEDEFCDKCGAEQKRAVTLEQQKTKTQTAISETSSQVEQRKGIRPSIAIALVLVLILAGAVFWYGSIPKTASFDIYVQSNTSWHGSYGTVGGMTTVDGSGNHDFYVQGTVVSAVFQLETDGGFLTVSIFMGSTCMARQTTSAAYGVVSVTATPSQSGISSVPGTC